MSRLIRKNIKLNAEVMKKLEAYKDSIHDFESKGRIPMTWNSFFTLIVSDWENSRAKCHCNHFYDCDHCRMLDEAAREVGRFQRR